MLRGEFESAGEQSRSELRGAYGDRLRSVVERAGVDAVVASTAIDRETVAAIAAGERPELTLESAAAVLAVDDNLPDAETIELEALDILLMGMTTAVVDVETVAAGLDKELEPKEIQQKVEGRMPITLDEYAAIHDFLEREARA